jgi:hypothetical protein
MFANSARRSGAALAVLVVAFSVGHAAPALADRTAPAPLSATLDDAAIAALRLQPGIELDATLAETLRPVIAKARAAEPQLADLHARPAYDFKSLVVQPSDPALLAAWKAGNLTSGNTAVDLLLADFGATGVSAVFQDYFQLDFARPLRMDRLATLLHALPGIRSSETNGTLGDGDDVRVETTTGGYLVTFDHGTGDCPAGCISHELTKVFVGDDGTVTVR